MKKTLLTERFQELAGIKPLTEQPTGADLDRLKDNPSMMDLGYMQSQRLGPYALDKDDRKIFTPADRLKNSSILSQINTGAKWAEVMDVLIKRADDISGLSDSEKRIYLQNALKAI